ncbi:hypothetical protein AB6A40_009083 [Gnathostoma spinigerum]|uniref:MADF domain-containing protein n=1 Tax=Gnathostoma spinigerum TaxID=75299 RepID=A0ABD6EW08_9BILA
MRERLIELCHINECLWNVHTPDYRQVVKKRNVLANIAKTLSEEYKVDLEVSHVTRQWQSLRDQYRRTKKRLETATCDVKPWRFWLAMKFTDLSDMNGSSNDNTFSYFSSMGNESGDENLQNPASFSPTLGYGADKDVGIHYHGSDSAKLERNVSSPSVYTSRPDEQSVPVAHCEPSASSTASCSYSAVAHASPTVTNTVALLYDALLRKKDNHSETSFNNMAGNNESNSNGDRSLPMMMTVTSPGDLCKLSNGLGEPTFIDIDNKALCQSRLKGTKRRLSPNGGSESELPTYSSMYDRNFPTVGSRGFSDVEDDYVMFGKAVERKVRSIAYRNPRIALILQKKINDTLFDAEMELLDLEKTNVCGEINASDSTQP